MTENGMSKSEMEETLALIRHYGRQIASPQWLTLRDDLVMWGRRVQELADSLPPSGGDCS